MAATLNYTVNLQRIDADNAIRNQVVFSASLSLPASIIGDDTLSIINNELDKDVGLLAAVMDFFYIESDKEIVVKFGATNGTPFTIRAGGSMTIDAKNLTALYISNTSGATATVRVIQALRQTL